MGPREQFPVDELPAPLGERATLVEFSSAFCLPCRATRHVLDDVAAMIPGVRRVEVDAEQRPDLARAIGVQGTPTTVVLDADGGEVTRATGIPRRADVIAALGRIIDQLPE